VEQETQRVDAPVPLFARTLSMNSSEVLVKHFWRFRISITWAWDTRQSAGALNVAKSTRYTAFVCWLNHLHTHGE
jgi:hypothetical protein